MWRMAAFDDSTDPELGAACNRLAAFVEPMPAGVLVDRSSGLTEDDLALILRHLHSIRLNDTAAEDLPDAIDPASYTTVPRTSRS